MAEAGGEVSSVADECRSLLDRAARAQPDSPEPLQALASLRSLQGYPDEALQLLRRSVAAWLPAGEEAPPPAAEPPSFEARFEAAKLLLDLDESTALCVRVLEGLLEERDDNADVWFMLALAHHGACAFPRARLCLDQAQQARPGRAAAARWPTRSLAGAAAAHAAAGRARLPGGGAGGAARGGGGERCRLGFGRSGGGKGGGGGRGGGGRRIDCCH